MIHPETGDIKVKEHPSTESGLQRGLSCFLNCCWSLAAARSNCSLGLGQWFMSNGIIYTKFIIINTE